MKCLELFFVKHVFICFVICMVGERDWCMKLGGAFSCCFDPSTYIIELTDARQNGNLPHVGVKTKQN